MSNRLSSLWLLLVLALATQLGAGAIVPSAPSALAALDAASVFCHGNPVHGKDQPAPHRRLADPAIVQATEAALVALALLSPAPFLPGPDSGLIGQAERPQPRAPPGLRAAAFYPTGPPTVS